MTAETGRRPWPRAQPRFCLVTQPPSRTGIFHDPTKTRPLPPARTAFCSATLADERVERLPQRSLLPSKNSKACQQLSLLRRMLGVYLRHGPTLRRNLAQSTVYSKAFSRLYRDHHRHMHTTSRRHPTPATLVKWYTLFARKTAPGQTIRRHLISIDT